MPKDQEWRTRLAKSDKYRVSSAIFKTNKEKILEFVRQKGTYVNIPPEILEGSIKVYDNRDIGKTTDNRRI